MELIVTPDRNTKDNDYKGAFDVEATLYARYWASKGRETTRAKIDVSKGLPSRLKQLLAWLRLITPAVGGTRHRLIVASHGWTTGIQVGPQCKDVDVLTAELKRLGIREVCLYCCSTGNDAKDSDTAPGTGDNGFADLLRDAMCRAGITDARVFAHSTAGHTSQNPDIRFFDGMGLTQGGVGGLTPVRRGTPQYQALRRLLKTTDRFELPWLTLPELEQMLRKYAK